MSKYKTVSQVCALAGLTRKHLYYFHHEKVVQAVAYANYSVEGNNGYKLYDDQAVERLRHIALYYQLGLKRNEIRDLMLAPDYDIHRTLAQLLNREKTREQKIQMRIAALSFLLESEAGIDALESCSLEELGKQLLEEEETKILEHVP